MILWVILDDRSIYPSWYSALPTPHTGIIKGIKISYEYLTRKDNGGIMLYNRDDNLVLRGLGDMRIGERCRVDGCRNWALRGGEGCRWHSLRGRVLGTRLKDSRGYVIIYLPGHSEASASGWAFEHRVVVSSLLGRPLREQEIVHHLDGDRANNSPNNLFLTDRHDHFRLFHTPPRRRKTS